MVKRLEYSTGKAKKAKNRSDTTNPVSLRGTPPCNLHFFFKMRGSPPHLAPRDLPGVALPVARDVAVCHTFSSPSFFGLPEGNRT